MNKTVAMSLNFVWEFREVLDCDSPLPLFVSNIVLEKCRKWLKFAKRLDCVRFTAAFVCQKIVHSNQPC